MERAYYFSESLIEGIKIGNLKNTVHGEFTHDILLKALATAAIAANLPTQLAAYKAAVETETHAGYKDVSDSIAEYVNTVLDPARDRAETGLKAGFRAVMEMPDEEAARAAEMLLKLMHKHHLLTKMNTDAQTDAVRDFISDVEDNHMAALRLTGMEVLFQKLRNANQAVCDAVISRDEADSDKVVKVMVEARKRTDEAYRNLMRGVEALVFLNGAEDYADFIAYANAVIRRYKRVHLGQSVESPQPAPGDVVDGDHVVDVPGENTPAEGEGNENNGGGGTTTPPGSIPANPQPGTDEDPDLYIYEL